MASIESTPDLQARRLLLFGVAGGRYACDIDAVREIVAARPATRLPGAPAWVIGLVNLRGTLLTVVHLAERLGAPRQTGGGDMMRLIIVAQVSGRLIGVGVDEVRNVQALGDDAFEPVDEERAAGGIIRGLAHVGGPGGETALVCDMDALAREALAA